MSPLPSLCLQEFHPCDLLGPLLSLVKDDILCGRVKESVDNESILGGVGSDARLGYSFLPGVS